MPNYINPFSYSSIGTTSARSSSNAWGNNIATRSKIGLYTKGSENATLAKIGPNKFGGSFNAGVGTFGLNKFNGSFNSDGINTFNGSSAIRSKLGSRFNSGSNTFGGSNVSSSNNRSFNNYGRIETSLTSTFKKKPTTKRYGYGSASIY